MIWYTAIAITLRIMTSAIHAVIGFCMIVHLYKQMGSSGKMV